MWLQVWNGNAASLSKGEELTWSAEAYNMLHRFSTPWPCLSFDVMPDALGAGRSRFPHTAYLVAASAVPSSTDNKLYVMKLDDMYRTQHDDKNADDPEAVAEDSDVDDDATMHLQAIPHPGPANRVRVMPQAPHVVATWAESGTVYIWDVRHKLAALDAKDAGVGALSETTAAAVKRQASPNGAVYSFAAHGVEGFSMDFSRVHAGRLATGDVSGGMFVWDPLASAQVATLGTTAGGSGAGVNGVSWRVRPARYAGHSGSVEDLQWSPTEPEVLASCSVDRSVCVWDTRTPAKPAFRVVASASHDINVLSWNRKVPYLLLSGADDGEFCVWDLRALRTPDAAAASAANHPVKTETVARSTWHRKPITSIQWSPHDANCLVACSEDDTVTVWDLSLEPDTDADADAAAAAAAAASASAGTEPAEADYPAQLLFIHQGQSQIKEAHFVEQIPGVIATTAGTGFNMFKPDVQLA